ncbi:DUF2066 domain-containing protein [Shewanella sp. AS1]|uniref:DUF2066 domain-containing protein n=1 Tax=Shewanella sp. AS1 TaxID=2907626 RepID=UPI001F467181|nr:DUF2066 domain-containing protein [Shewanella sp. AS1]MCE9678561.1 DUF2066 domain-containing protein [Shewanella sp. AS1]
MFKNHIFAIFSAALLLLSVSVQAQERLQLDESNVKVEDRTSQTQQNALQQALRNVVLKNAGSQSVLSNPTIASAIKSPTNFIRQFGYQENEGQLYLHVSFDLQKVVRLLRDAQLPVWGTQRPLTLFWLVQDEDERTILNDESTTETRAFIRELAGERGVPTLLPIMDLDDRMKITANDVRGMFVDHVVNASARYGTDYFVMASIEPSDNGERRSYTMALYPVRGDNALFTPLTQASGAAADTDSALEQIYSAISEYYAGRYAVADTGESLMTQLNFVQITERKQLVDIEHYLGQLTAVKRVTLTRLQGDSAIFSLQLFGTEADLSRLLNLESKVKRQSNSRSVDQDPLTSSQNDVANYIWLGQ